MEHVENKRNELVEKKIEENLSCKINYEKNWCHEEDSIIPEQCEIWRKCKDSDPKAKVSIFKAITSGIADTINSFFEELSPKTTISLFIILM
jgi:Di-sulfide bridge nucleocytoplasmic transport domain